VAYTKQEHIQKAQETLGLRACLDHAKDGAIGWSITMLFYSALHYVEAYFTAVRGFGCKHHFSRATEIQNDPRISSLFPDYRLLENLSREARYDITTFNAGDLRCAQRCFDTIKSAIEALI
jgi:hypothetical protein